MQHLVHNVRKHEYNEFGTPSAVRAAIPPQKKRLAGPPPNARRDLSGGASSEKKDEELAQPLAARPTTGAGAGVGRVSAGDNG